MSSSGGYNILSNEKYLLNSDKISHCGVKSENYYFTKPKFKAKIMGKCQVSFNVCWQLATVHIGTISLMFVVLQQPLMIQY